MKVYLCQWCLRVGRLGLMIWIYSTVEQRSVSFVANTGNFLLHIIYLSPQMLDLTFDVEVVSQVGRPAGAFRGPDTRSFLREPWRSWSVKKAKTRYWGRWRLALHSRECGLHLSSILPKKQARQVVDLPPPTIELGEKFYVMIFDVSARVKQWG